MTKISSRWIFTLAATVTVAISTSASAQTFTLLYNFATRGGDPAEPTSYGTPTQGRDGKIYATSTGGGAHNGGTVFRLTPGKPSVLYSFCSLTNCDDGDGPGGLTLGYDGNFYGATIAGGTQIWGTLFKITPLGVFTQLYNFTGEFSDGAAPDTPPIRGNDGNLYGTTTGGNSDNLGSVYQLNPTTGVVTPIFEFDINNGNVPLGGLTLGPDGNFYGVTGQGGAGECRCGVVYKITPAGVFSLLYSFDDTHGAAPAGPLALGNDGNFYGITLAGGANGLGVIYKIAPGGGSPTVLYNFSAAQPPPSAGLVTGTDGNFYGVTPQGGNSSTACLNGTCGVLFQFTPGGTFSVIHDFDGTEGFAPQVTPYLHTSGLLYGDTVFGGSGVFCRGDKGEDLCGTLYQMDNNLPAFITLMPYTGGVGRGIQFLGQGFTSTTVVSFNGTSSTPTTVAPDGTWLIAHVPAGATTGFVTATTSTGTLTSNQQFIVKP